MKSIQSLKTRLNSKNLLNIQNENGFLSEVGFEWKNPVSDEEIKNFEELYHIILPDKFIEFLKISNGAILYKDLKYGQWGCKILSLNELIKETAEVKEKGYNIKDEWIVFAKWIGDGDMLLFDLTKSNNNKNNYIIDGDQGYQTDDWDYIKGNFEKWLDRLIVAQGAKYWRWY